MSTVYSLAANIMKYVFLGLLVYFVVTLIVRSVSEYRYFKYAQKLLHLSIRYVEILAPERYKGTVFRLADKNSIGKAEDSDIRLASSLLKAHHARIDLIKGEYRFSTKQRRFSEINGQRVLHKKTSLADGDTVWIQDVCFVCRKTRKEKEEDV